MKHLFLLLAIIISTTFSQQVNAQKGGVFTVGVQDTLTMSSSVDSAIYYLGFDFDAAAPEGYTIDFTIWSKRISGTPIIVSYPETTNFDGKNATAGTNNTKDFWVRDYAHKDTLRAVTGSFSQHVSYNAKSKNFRLVLRGSGTGIFIVRPAWYWRKKSGF